MANNLACLLGDQRNRKGIGFAQSINDEVFRLVAVGMGFKRLARNFADRVFVTGAFRSDSEVHGLKGQCVRLGVLETPVSRLILIAATVVNGIGEIVAEFGSVPSEPSVCGSFVELDLERATAGG